MKPTDRVEMILSIDESPETLNVSLQEFLESDEYPKQLYKYRSWNNALHRRIIMDLEVYMASPKQFEDYNDCRNHVRYDGLSESDFLLALRDFVRRTFPKWNEEARKREVQNLLVRNQLRNSEFVQSMADSTFEDWNQRIGILSLAGSHSNDEMWEKYSDSDRGFCVVFNSEKLFQFVGGGGKVEYVPELPVILPEPFHSTSDQIRLQVYQKENRWSFEDEYRTMTFSYKPMHPFQRKRVVSSESINTIILGRNCSGTHAGEIRTCIHNKIGEIKGEHLDENGRTHLLVNPLEGST